MSRRGHVARKGWNKMASAPGAVVAATTGVAAEEVRELVVIMADSGFLKEPEDHVLLKAFWTYRGAPNKVRFLSKNIGRVAPSLMWSVAQEVVQYAVKHDAHAIVVRHVSPLAIMLANPAIHPDPLNPLRVLCLTCDPPEVLKDLGLRPGRALEFTVTVWQILPGTPYVMPCACCAFSHTSDQSHLAHRDYDLGQRVERAQSEMCHSHVIELPQLPVR